MRLILSLTILVICLFPTNILAQYPHKLSMCDNIKDFSNYMEYSKSVNYQNTMYSRKPCDKELDKLIENILDYKASFDYLPWYLQNAMLISTLIVFGILGIWAIYVDIQKDNAKNKSQNLVK